MRLQFLRFAAYSLLSAINARAQATIGSAPERNYLLEVTQLWGADSFLGSLIERSMAGGDTELRVWGGYGLTGTTGVVMRRSGGRWQAWRVEVVRAPTKFQYPSRTQRQPELIRCFADSLERHVEDRWTVLPMVTRSIQ